MKWWISILLQVFTLILISFIGYNMEYARPTKNHIIWKPHPGPQTEILTRSESELLFGGARGGGKTEAGFAWLMEPPFAENPRCKGLVIRRNADDLSDWVERARMFFEGQGKITGNPPIIRFTSGAFVRTGHLKDEGAYTKYLGHEYQKILIEELTQIPTLKLYLQLISCARSTVPGIDAQIYCSTNPGGVGHRWVKERFVKLAQNHTYFDPISKKSRIFIPSRVTDNPTIMENDPHYIHFLDSLPPGLREAWRDGNWDVFEGQFFPMFSKDMEIKPFMIPEEWLLYGSLDPAWGGTCSFGLSAIDYTGFIYRLFTYQGAGLSVKQNSENIRDYIRGFQWTDSRNPSMIVAGRDAFAQKDRHGVVTSDYTFSDIFTEITGLSLTRGADNPGQRIPGWWAVKDCLAQNKWGYFENFNNLLIEEFVDVEADEKIVEDLKGLGRDPNVKDHGLDENRLLIMAAYKPPAPVKPDIHAGQPHWGQYKSKKKDRRIVFE